MNIVAKDWPWPHELQQRDTTKYIVIHHTAGPQNQDTNEIWAEHINIGDNGIAYHLVIKGDGTVVQGRPMWAVGAHAHGVNFESVGIVLEGNFQEGQDNYVIPTDAQMASLKDAVAYCKKLYPGATVIGHCDVANITGDLGDATACPGNTLYAKLSEVQ